jgi:hypothetical protein
MHRRYLHTCKRIAVMPSSMVSSSCRRPPAGGETEALVVFGPLLLGIGIGLLAGPLLVWALIGLGAGITLKSVVSEREKGGRRRVH